MSEANTGQGSTEQGQQGQEGQQGQQGQEAQGQQPAYYEAFKDENLKTNPAVLKYRTTEDLARGLVAAEARLGVPADQLLKLPKGPDDKEGFAAVMKGLGAPDTADGYKFEFAEGTAEADKAAVGEFAKAMHAAGPFPPQFMKSAVEWWSGEVAKRNQADLEAATAATAAGDAALKTEWGQAYEQRKADIGKLLADHGGQALADEFNASPLGDNPQLAIALGKIVEKLAEPGPKDDTKRGGDTGVMTPAQAKAKARELETHPAFLDASHGLHKDITKQRNNALRMAEGLDPLP